MTFAIRDLLRSASGMAAEMNGVLSFPSPRLRGEGGEDRRSEPGEGVFRLTHAIATPPHPTFSLRSKVDLSPHAGRGERKAA
jgi:hypothetical protein